jgi:inorganic pyrophosphatase
MRTGVRRLIKVLCVPATDPRMNHLRELDDAFAHDLREIQHFFREIQHFFEAYQDLEPGKSFASSSSRLGRAAAAEQEITAARARLATGSRREHDARSTPAHDVRRPAEL